MTDKPDTSETSSEKNDDLYDVFDDVRESLVSDEQQKEKHQSQGRRVLQFLKGIRLPKLSKKKNKEDKAGLPEDNLADAHLVYDDAELEERLLAEYLDEVEESADEALGVEEIEDPPEEEIVDELDLEPEPVPVERLSVALEGDIGNLRDTALKDYTEEELEDVNERKMAWLDFVQAPSSQMRRVEWVMIMFVGLFVGGLIIWLGIRATGGLHLSEVAPTRTPDPNVPIPASVQLPGGWTFRLSKGVLNADGKWEPFGAEWLQGTEICKWITLPWSAQLEAVIQTLKSGDEIEVTMSNYDVLTYHVYSRQKVDSMQTEELNLDTPSILIILASQDSDRKLVLTAVLNYEDLE